MNSALHLQVQLLEQQIELEESNYNNAIQLGKDYSTLKNIRAKIKELKETLLRVKQEIKEFESKDIDNSR